MRIWARMVFTWKKGKRSSGLPKRSCLASEEYVGVVENDA